MSRERLARPDGTNVFRGVVADGKHEIEFGGVGLCKLVPTLASETVVRWTLRVRVLVVMLWTAAPLLSTRISAELSAQRSFLPQQSQ